MTPRGPAGRQSARGQTLPDFAVGVAIFLLTVTFVFLFVPQMALPYEDQEQPVVAERVASDLVGHHLAETGGTGLNESCTVAFHTRDTESACGTGSVHDQVGISSTYGLNVTLRDAPSDDPDSGRVCYDGTSITGCESGDPLPGVGQPLPEDDQSVAIARHRVSVGGTGAVLEVGVW